MAGPLKDMMRSIGLTESHIEGTLKEIPCEMLAGNTPRYAMQTIGTEWGRNIMGQDFWVSIAESQALERLDRGDDVVIDDIRFQNEADMVRRLGGAVIGINGRGGIMSDHVSECGIGADMYITNDGSIDDFLAMVLYIIHRADH
jgi:hypothetical protein